MVFLRRVQGPPLYIGSELGCNIVQQIGRNCTIDCTLAHDVFDTVDGSLNRYRRYPIFGNSSLGLYVDHE